MNMHSATHQPIQSILCCRTSAKMRAADDTIIMSDMTYINTQRSASKHTITACQAKVKFKVSVWMQAEL